MEITRVGDVQTPDGSVTQSAPPSAGSVSDAVYGAGWNGDTTVAPSKNAVYDKIETLGGSKHVIKDEAGAGLTARTNLNFTGTGVSATDNAGTDSTDVTIAGGGSTNSFATIDCPSGTDPVADSATDTLQLLAGAGITITGDATADSVTISGTTIDHNHTAGGDGGVLTGDVHDSYSELIEVATPSNPAADRGRLFARANGSNIELVFLSSQGIECIICSEPDNTVNAELQLNWVE